VAGDEPAFETLVERHQHRAYALARRLVGSDGDAQDVLQESFLSVYRKLGSFRGEARFSTWLHRIVTNAALMHLRARARRPQEPLDAFLPRFDGEGRHAQEPADLDAAGQAADRLDRATLARAGQGGRPAPARAVPGGRSSCATWRSCRRARSRSGSASDRTWCGSACIARACCCADTWVTRWRQAG
jgi:RNA polymerase sigma factor (sigma-70 family)